MNERMHKQKEQMRSAQDSIQKPLVPDLEVNKTSRKETCLLMVAITLEPTKISAFGSSRCLRGRLDPLSLPPSAAGEMGHTASDSSPQPTGPVERLKRCVPQGRLRQGPWGGGHPTQTGVSLAAVHLCVLGQVASPLSLRISSAEREWVVEMPPFTDPQ